MFATTWKNLPQRKLAKFLGESWFLAAVLDLNLTKKLKSEFHKPVSLNGDCSCGGEFSVSYTLTCRPRDSNIVFSILLITLVFKIFSYGVESSF